MPLANASFDTVLFVTLKVFDFLCFFQNFVSILYRNTSFFKWFSNKTWSQTAICFSIKKNNNKNKQITYLRVTAILSVCEIDNLTMSSFFKSRSTFEESSSKDLIDMRK